jgi:hypothetical protein
MKLLAIKRSAIAILGICISACSTAKLEARFEANPQCKEVVNPKTGAVMPCPGSDKAFYQSMGLEPVKLNQANSSLTPVTSATTTLNLQSSAPATEIISKQDPSSAQAVDCKPTIHKKTGGILPCPSTN